MCLQLVSRPEPDLQIAAVIAAMYGAGKTERPLPVLIRDRLGEWLEDEKFAAAFGTRGKPGCSSFPAGAGDGAAAAGEPHRPAGGRAGGSG